MRRIFGILFIAIFCNLIITAQCPSVTCVSTLALTSCTTIGSTIVATSNYSNNITSRWIGPNNIPIASIGTATSLATLNHGGTYTVEFKDNASNCVITKTVSVIAFNLSPSFSIAASANNLSCVNSTVHLIIFNAQTNPNPGPLTYTLLAPGIPTTLANGVLGNIFSYTINSCGNWIFITRDNGNSCISSYDVTIGCGTIVPAPITISGSNTVCLGSSTTFTSSGAVSYTWNNASNSPTLNVTPSINTNYTVNGKDANGCNTSASVAVTVNTNCANVWPGDANSDGIVNNTDVFELGLWSNMTGSARTPTSINYSSQFANVWTGTVSSGKNRCHADCNGDGIINATDMTAISSNFLLTHAFKPFEENSVNSDLTIIANQPLFNAGMWNKVDLMLGDAQNSINQLYGLAFDLDYDKNLIEMDSVYIKYTPSFLNASNQSIEFGKTIFNNAKLYGASVRVDGNNVNGSGKIAEFYFKLKFNLPSGSIMNLVTSNVKKISKAAVSSTLTGSSLSLGIDNNMVGIDNDNLFINVISLYPNPSSKQITLISKTQTKINYTFYDIIGREILNGNFSNVKTLDVSDFKEGAYFIRFESGKNTEYKKLVIER